MHIPNWTEVHARGPTARAQALSDWWIEPQQRLGADWQERFVAGLAKRLAQAGLDDCVYAGYGFDRAGDPLHGSVVRHGILSTVTFSEPRGDAPHRACCIGSMDDATARVWVDGTELEVLELPRHADGRPQANPHADGWCAGRYYFVQLAGLFDHPGQDPQSRSLLSTQRALLIWDAQRRCQRIETPLPDERWPSPRLMADGTLLRVVPDGDPHVPRATARTLGTPW